MSKGEWFLAVVATIAVWACCYLYDEYNNEPTSLQEITVYGHSITN